MLQFKWMNESSIEKAGDCWKIDALPKSDFFCNNETIGKEGMTPASLSNAPFYYTEVSGDFVMRAKVSLDFKSTYDSSSIMVMHDAENWAKACFELTDFNTHAVVSVVTTNGYSDDANGCNIDVKSVWLQVCRVGQSFAFHYSTDGEKFYMMRFFHLPAEETIKVGLLAQSPTGDGGSRIYKNLSVKNDTVKNIRMGE